MFENIILGPMCLVSKDFGESFHLKGLIKDSWMPIGRITKGETFNELKKDFAQTKFDYVIMSIGFRTAYHE